MNLKDALSLIRDVPNYPKPGIVFKDLTPVFENAQAFEVLINALVQSVALWKPEKIVAVESRGFLLGSPMALQLNCGLVLVRKKGKLPRRTFSQSYDLEYGTDQIEMHEDSLKPRERVVIVDDVLATGGTLEAAVKLCEQAQAQVVGLQVILELGFLNGRERFNSSPIKHLMVVSRAGIPEH